GPGHDANMRAGARHAADIHRSTRRQGGGGQQAAQAAAGDVDRAGVIPSGRLIDDSKWRTSVSYACCACPPLVNEAKRNRKLDVAAPTRTPAAEQDRPPR